MFLDEVIPGAIQAYKKYGVLPSLTLSQACLESNWGKCAPNYNLFGIKWSSGCGRDYQELQTKEYLNGKWITVLAKFRKYNSYAESIEDHAILLNKSWYAPVLKAKDYKEACKQVQSCGYATDPNYATQLIKIIEQYGLNKYDEVLTMEDLRKALNIPDAKWAKEQVDLLKQNGLITSDHDPNEIVTFGVFATVINNLFKKIKGE